MGGCFGVCTSSRSKLPSVPVVHRQVLSAQLREPKNAHPPQITNDDDISCPLPTTEYTDDGLNIDFFTYAVKHAQLLSAIQKRLHTVRGLQQSFENTMKTINELEQQLEAWEESLPNTLRLDTSMKWPQLPPTIHPYLVAYLHLAYYGAFISIHIIFAYPWILASTGMEHNSTVDNQANRSTEILVKASRKIVLIVRQFETDVSSPIW